MIKFLLMLLGSFSVLIQEQVQVNGFIKFEFGVVFDKLLVLNVVIDTVELEHQDVWRTADPRLKHLPLAFFVASVTVDLGLSEGFPSLIKLAFVDSELYRSHFIDILIVYFRASVRVD